MSDRRYPAGIDCAWLALDSKDHLGAFITGGIGPVPIEVLRNMVRPIQCIEDDVLKLPRTSEVKLFQATGDVSSFVDLAERGLFVYDYADVCRVRVSRTDKYELQAVPHNPVGLDSLPKELAILATTVKFEGVDFSDCLAVDPGAYMECASGD